MNPMLVVVLAVQGVIFLVLALVLASFFSVWLKALISGAHVGFAQLIGMKLRRVNMQLVVDCRIMALHAGVNISTSELESHYLAGGNVTQVVTALVKARKSGLPMTFRQLADIDLAGYDPVEAVQPGINAMPVGVQQL